MKTVLQLKQLGFTFERDVGGVDITVVTHPEAFRYYNPRFNETLTEIHGEASREAARSMTVAGHYEDRDPFPYVLLQESEFIQLHRLAMKHERLRRMQDDLSDQFKALATEAKSFIGQL